VSIRGFLSNTDLKAHTSAGLFLPDFLLHAAEPNIIKTIRNPYRHLIIITSCLDNKLCSLCFICAEFAKGKINPFPLILKFPEALT
jgi:hypothetical protein